MNREVHVRICERLGVQFPGPTRHLRRFKRASAISAVRSIPDELQSRSTAKNGRARTAALLSLPNLRHRLSRIAILEQRGALRRSTDWHAIHAALNIRKRLPELKGHQFRV